MRRRTRAKLQLVSKAPPPAGPVQILIADPPWKFGDGIQGRRGASHKYPCMDLDKIARFQLPEMADNAMLFLWRVAAMQEEALFICKAWGFRPYSELTWLKMTKHGKVHMGMGHVVRAAHESCLIGIRGRRVPPATLGERSVLIDEVREHSAKPESFYGLIDRLYPNEVKHELFARRTREGWHQSGNQLGILDDDPHDGAEEDESDDERVSGSTEADNTGTE